MNQLDETKSAAMKFLDQHEAVIKDNESLNALLAQNKELITEQMQRIDVLEMALDRAEGKRDEYLRFSVELSSQLQFIIAGSARALSIAMKVMNAVNRDQTPVPGSDVAEVERILRNLPSAEENENMRAAVGLEPQQPKTPVPAAPIFGAPSNDQFPSGGTIQTQPAAVRPQPEAVIPRNLNDAMQGHVIG